MSTSINGLAVNNITYAEPVNSLPNPVREAAATRGYGDSAQTLSLFVNNTDVNEAFACAAQGNGAACIMANAGQRLGAKAVYFYRTTAWIDFGEGPIVRFETGKSVYANVIEPFDAGDRERVKPGLYHLTPPRPSQTLPAKRAVQARKDQARREGARPLRRVEIGQQHTERVVMAARV